VLRCVDQQLIRHCEEADADEAIQQKFFWIAHALAARDDRVSLLPDRLITNHKPL
jgi:hypothetical protein